MALGTASPTAKPEEKQELVWYMDEVLLAWTCFLFTSHLAVTAIRLAPLELLEMSSSAALSGGPKTPRAAFSGCLHLALGCRESLTRVVLHVPTRSVLS